MNIQKQANKYAEGKANEAITKAIAEAYIEGYKAGYKDREEEIPMELRTNQVEYVDLGLPSGTLWSTDYERLDGKIQYLTYEKAKTMKLPTKRQWDELYSVCKWKCIFCSNHYYAAECVGPNGQALRFICTGLIRYTTVVNGQDSYFWLEDEEKEAVHLIKRRDFHIVKGCLTDCFKSKLPVRLVN